VPELPNIQALKPATKKKIMSATVATAKLWSARRHPSDDQMAQVWQRIAETYADSTVLHIPSGGSDQPGVQQQQQDQPDDDKKD
jgi:hypothetical protein